MLQGARRRLELLVGRRTCFPPPHVPEAVDPRALHAELHAWARSAPERHARLFLAGTPLLARRSERALLERWAACGLVESLGASIVRPCVRLFPLYGRTLATDLLSHRDPDQVFSLMFEQVYLVRNMDVRPGDRVLEPCLGSGVISLFAADVAQAVTGVDVNPRALAFARFNQALSPAPVPVEMLHGSLCEPLEPGRVFDLLVVNPPFELVPRGATWFLHSDGGEDGLDVVRALLRQAPARLAPGGRMDLITWSPAGPGGAVLVDLLREALPHMRLQVHVLDTQPLDAHLVPFRASAGFPAFRERLAARGLTEVQFLFVHAAPAATGGVELLHPAAEVETCRELAQAWS